MPCQEHKKRYCRDCNFGFCPHSRVKYACKDCGGISICPHNRRKNTCKDCGGSGICPHNRMKQNCKDCGGSGICEHNRRKRECKDCGGGVKKCPHNRRKYQCKECGGIGICEHGKHKFNCKECNDPIPITIRTMIKGAKQKDKRRNQYDIVNLVDTDFLKNLIEDNETCCYCECILQYRLFQPNLGTLERIDNTLGHIKTNCKIACLTCNVSRVGQR